MLLPEQTFLGWPTKGITHCEGAEEKLVDCVPSVALKVAVSGISLLVAEVVAELLGKAACEAEVVC